MFKKKALRKEMKKLEKMYNRNWEQLYENDNTPLRNKILKLKRKQIRHRMEVVQKQLDELSVKKADVKASA